MKSLAAALLTLAAAAGAAAPARAAGPSPATGVPPGHAVATFAAGCFWCVEADFDKVAGVTATISGYMGGRTANPTYEQVSAGSTGHAEVVQVVFDPRKVSYEKLLEVFWVNVDPTVKDRQFCDAGSQYRPGIFYHDEAQRKAAEASRAQVEKTKAFRQPLVLEISMASAFTPAEEYHQDYYRKNPVRYQLYRTGCGRDARLKELWGDRAGGRK